MLRHYQVVVDLIWSTLVSGMLPCSKIKEKKTLYSICSALASLPSTWSHWRTFVLSTFWKRNLPFSHTAVRYISFLKGATFYLLLRTESSLRDAAKELNVGDESKHTLLCIVPLCPFITHEVGLASCLVRMWTRVRSIPLPARRLADVFRGGKSNSICCFSVFELHTCLTWSWLLFCFWCAKWAAWRPVHPAHLPASCHQWRSVKARVGGWAGITSECHKANGGQKKELCIQSHADMWPPCCRHSASFHHTRRVETPDKVKRICWLKMD